MRFFTSIILLLFFYIEIEAQGSNNTFKLPEVLPPSPDLATLTKGAELRSTPHTGGANSSIPIYELKLRNFSLPISVNYSSTGFKPEEIPSRVGLSWSLNAGGAVTRIVKGKPDDYCSPPAQYLTESQVLAKNSNSFFFLEDLEDQNSNHDSQPDEYRYTVNGLTGKFIIKRDGSVLQLPYNNVKIIVLKSQGAVTDIIITDGGGVKYTFGGGVQESTLEHNLVYDLLQKQTITTAWMLTNVTLPNGDYIDFSYGSLTHYVNSGVIQSVRKGILGPACNETLACPVEAQYSERTNTIRYSSRYLTAINTNTGTAVAILYEDRPDAGGDNRVNQILVSNGYGTTLRKAVFQYLDRHIPNPPFNEGFFLKKVILKDPTTSSNEEQVFELHYVDEENALAGAAITNNIDHLGFANGASNSTLLPVVNTYVYNGFPLFASYGTANREPNGVYAQKGMLQRIVYPTGGHDEFHYEPNMKTWWGNIEKKKIISARLTETGGYPSQFYNTYFTVCEAQTGEFHLSTEWIGPLPVPGGDPAPKVAIATLYDNSTGLVIEKRTAFGYSGFPNHEVWGDFHVPLSPGINYRFELEVRNGPNNKARADIVYDQLCGTEWGQINEELCGVRVRKIVSYDNVSRKSHSKFYHYRSLTDTLNPSAQKLYYPQYVTAYSNGLYCGSSNLEILCNGFLLSSNSATTLYDNEAGGVVYKWVIESDDSLFSNGGVEHTFIKQGQFIGNQIIGETVPNPPVDPYNYMNGLESQTRFFNHNMEFVKKITNYYSTDSRINDAEFNNYIVRKRFSPMLAGTPPWDDYDFQHLDVTSYSIFTRWDHLDRTVTEEYDLVNNKVITSEVLFTYGSANNILPTQTKIYDSEGTELRKEIKYPNDFSYLPVCSTMVAKNIVEPVLEEKSYKETKLLSQTNTEYRDWFNNGSILAPEFIKISKGNGAQETRARYYQYDAKGNPLEVAKENDIRLSYIWDYNATLPIAEVNNGSWGQGIAYCSFETTAKGGWTYSGTALTEGTEPGGKKSYNLANANITYNGTLITGKKYVVSYWIKGGSVLVNGNAGIIQLSKNGWSLYRGTIIYSGNGGVTVSGTGYIDELRLYPDGAFMKSFTYSPEVGITSAADINNIFQTYEYDAFNRLLRIRDMDRNILKQFEYKFGTDLTGCNNSTPDWQMTGNYRCAKNNMVNNNNTGIKEREEMDLNNCSESYGQTRWMSIGSSAECPVLSNCSGLDKRVVNGVCETGCKKLLKSEYLGSLVWICTFRYEWTDGFKGPEFTESGPFHCLDVICDL